MSPVHLMMPVTSRHSCLLLREYTIRPLHVLSNHQLLLHFLLKKKTFQYHVYMISDMIFVTPFFVCDYQYFLFKFRLFVTYLTCKKTFNNSGLVNISFQYFNHFIHLKKIKNISLQCLSTVKLIKLSLKTINSLTWLQLIQLSFKTFNSITWLQLICLVKLVLFLLFQDCVLNLSNCTNFRY